MKTIVIIPTYNERDNIRDIVAAIRQEVTRYSLDILVVDSASPDKTADAVNEMKKNDNGIYLYSQSAKLGLGKAYLDGMDWALEHNYECIITMDADFSHHPKYLNFFFEKIKTHDLVIGSRYVPGGDLKNWPWARRVLSRFANWYASLIMGLPFSDLTSGFHCFRAELLRKVLRYKIHSEGYAFLMEMKSLSLLQGARYEEIPIIFNDRTKGDSKISKRVIFESASFVLKRAGQRNRFKKITAQASTSDVKKQQNVLV